jgi:hypothetical protein
MTTTPAKMALLLLDPQQQSFEVQELNLLRQQQPKTNTSTVADVLAQIPLMAWKDSRLAQQSHRPGLLNSRGYLVAATTALRPTLMGAAAGGLPILVAVPHSMTTAECYTCACQLLADVQMTKTVGCRVLVRVV